MTVLLLMFRELLLYVHYQLDVYKRQHGYNTQTELKDAFSESQKQLDHATNQLMEMNADLKSINRQIHYTVQYLAHKALYTEF